MQQDDAPQPLSRYDRFLFWVNVVILPIALWNLCVGNYTILAASCLIICGLGMARIIRRYLRYSNWISGQNTHPMPWTQYLLPRQPPSPPPPSDWHDQLNSSTFQPSPQHNPVHPNPSQVYQSPMEQPTELRDNEPTQQATRESPHPLSPGDAGYDPRYDPQLYVGGWIPKRPKQRPAPVWQPSSAGLPGGTAYPFTSTQPHPSTNPWRAVLPTQRWSQIGCGFFAIIIVAGLCSVLVNGVTGNGDGTPALSDDPVTACNGVTNKLWSNAPGTLAAQVSGHTITHFYSSSSLTLIYTGTSGDSFAVSSSDDSSFLPTTVGIEAVPYFDGNVQFADATSTSIPITQSDIHGSTLTISVQFPFTHPTATPDNTLLQTGGTPYTKPGPYCFNVNIPYTRPDGEQDVGATFMGLYEEPAAV